MENQQFYYAGFWKRFVAYIIDEILIGSVTFVLLLPLYLFFGVGVFALDNLDKYEYSNVSVLTQYSSDDDLSAAFIIAIVFAVLIVAGVSIVVQWLYFALMESSSKQATLGKMALGLKVTDMQGNRISFGRATGRYFGKILSGVILHIGYIMAAFTAKKQALHDMMANCLVIMDSQHHQQYTGGINENIQNSTSV